MEWKKNHIGKWTDIFFFDLYKSKAVQVSHTIYSRISLVRTSMVRSHVVVRRLCPVPNYTYD